jgi:hypothetical protein
MLLVVDRKVSGGFCNTNIRRVPQDKYILHCFILLTRVSVKFTNLVRNRGVEDYREDQKKDVSLTSRTAYFLIHVWRRVRATRHNNRAT